METQVLTILCGDALEKLRELPSESIHCCVTSPPYWGLRDYGTASWEGGLEECDHQSPPRGGRNPETAGKQLTNAGTLDYQFNGDCGKCGAKRIDSQLGLEKTPEEYVAKMVEVFREMRRVLRKDGTLWLNLGSSYASASACDRRNIVGNGSPDSNCQRPNRLGGAFKDKDLIPIPWMVAMALQADGWYLRQDIIWAKPNPMPESVTDRCTKAHEYLFLLTKSARYFYDAEAIKEKANPNYVSRYDYEFNVGAKETNGAGRPDAQSNTPGRKEFNGNRNKRSVWTVATAPYPDAHFATYPPDLIKPCIMAGTSAKGCCAKCGAPWERIMERGREYHHETYRDGKTMDGPYAKQAEIRNGILPISKTLGWQPTCECGLEESGYDVKQYGNLRIPVEKESLPYWITNTLIPCTVLDPFAGSGTTGAVALELGRKAMLIELNPKYVGLIETRCNVTMGLALA